MPTVSFTPDGKRIERAWDGEKGTQSTELWALV